MPGRVAASDTSTAPLARATKKAYACSHPRMRGLPMSTGFSFSFCFSAVALTPTRLRHRRLLVRNMWRIPRASPRKAACRSGRNRPGTLGGGDGLEGALVELHQLGRG